MSDARLANAHRLLVALEELRIVVEGTDFPFLQQPAIAGVVFDRRQRMRVKVEDLELEPGGGLEPVHHPGELRAADKDAELALLRFCLHLADRPLRYGSKQQRCNGAKPVTRRPPAAQFGLNSPEAALQRLF